MRILLVDDTEDVRETVGAMAKSLGHDVIAVDNAIIAVKLAAADPPDLVLMDLFMPEVDGAQAAAALHSISPLRHLRIVLITAFPEKLSPHVREGSWDGLLIKPFNLHDLERVLKRFDGGASGP
ncbi:MAG TPA: response regulator [Terriglobia bacterium]